MLTYAAVSLLGTASFFFLHYLGNQLLPYDLAQQRFKAEFEAGRPDEGVARGYKTNYEYCELSETVVAGAKWAGEGNVFHQSLALRTFEDMPGADDRCYELDLAVNVAPNGAEVPESWLRPRYWWGSKALYAIALRYLSVHEIRELTRISTRIAYLLLAVSLLLLAPKTLLLAAPLLVFGAFSSGIEYWADVANGLPYLWAVLSAAILVWLMRGGPSPGTLSGTAPVFCFAAGMVSSWLWLGDGHAFLAITWIGLLVWFGYDTPSAAERTRRAVSCMALHVVGFLACYGLGLIVKAVFWGYEGVWSNFWVAVLSILDRSVDGVSTELTARLGGLIDSFYVMAWPSWLPAGGVVPTSVAASSLVVSVGFAIFQARRGRPDSLHGIVWIIGLMSVNSPQFLITEDIWYRTARFVFVPLALCLSCLVLSVRTMDRRLSSAMLGVVLVVSGSVSWYFIRADTRAVDALVAGAEDIRPVIGSTFDVYLDGNRLVYVKDECSDEDVDAWFILHLHPADEEDLPERRKRHGFDNLDFNFERYGRRTGGRCAAVRALPEYEVRSIHTGQYMPGKDPEWSVDFSVPISWSFAAATAIDKLIESVEDTRPVIESTFDVYLDGNRLVYVKGECSDEDVDAWFILHLRPADEEDLPERRKPHGFDNLDFPFERYGRRAGGRCAAVRVLPEYEVRSIRTGQYAPGKDPEWSVDFSVPISWSFATVTAIDKLIESIEDTRPVIESTFDVYLDGNRLVYVKDECSDEDVAARFILHLRPADEEDLPERRKPHGFDNLDFNFERYGRRAGGRCAAVRALPEYEVGSIRTGAVRAREGSSLEGWVSLEGYSP